MTAPVPRPGILEIAPYIGGEGKSEGSHRLIRLASNEGGLGPSPRAAAAYQALAGELHRYPDGGGAALTEALAARHRLEAGQIVLGAGSDELLSLVTRAYAGPGDEVLYPQYGFLMYPIAARTVGATPVTAPETNLTASVDALLAAVTAKTRLLFLANPNNPTGSCLPAAELRRLHAGLPGHVVLVIDAAYAEFVTAADYTAGQDLVQGADNVVMARTFSKAYALAALRLGWAYASPAIAGVLHRVRGPFNVNAAAQAAGIAALEDEPFLETARRHNEVCRDWFAGRLGALGLRVHPSAGNFVLVDFSAWGEAEAVRLYLKDRGILVRQMGGYKLPHCLRITIGRTDEMHEVAEALAGYRETIA
ncbi:MAG: histidinol-phosphate transaminase [Rhodospirillaceae bacterium]